MADNYREKEKEKLKMLVHYIHKSQQELLAAHTQGVEKLLPLRRFIVVSGPPGTGKSHIIDKLLTSIGCNYTFVRIGSEKGAIISAIKTLNRQQGGQPAILVLDDGGRFFNNKTISAEDLGFLDPRERWIRDPKDGTQYQLPDMIILIINYPLNDLATRDRTTLEIDFQGGFTEEATFAICRDYVEQELDEFNQGRPGEAAVHFSDKEWEALEAFCASNKTTSIRPYLRETENAVLEAEYAAYERE